MLNRLTWDDVYTIKKLMESGASNKSLAEGYGMSPNAISDIRRGKTWKLSIDDIDSIRNKAVRGKPYVDIAKEHNTTVDQVMEVSPPDSKISVAGEFEPDTLGFTVNPDLHQALIERAGELGISVSGLCRGLISSVAEKGSFKECKPVPGGKKTIRVYLDKAMAQHIRDAAESMGATISGLCRSCVEAELKKGEFWVIK